MRETIKLLYAFLKITTNYSKLNFAFICLLLLITFTFETLSIFTVAPILSIMSGNQFVFEQKIFQDFYNLIFSSTTLINTLLFLGICILIKSIFLIISLFIQNKITLSSLKKIQQDLYKGLMLTKYEKLVESKTSHISNYLFPELERLRRGANTSNAIILNLIGIFVLFSGTLFINSQISIFFLSAGILLSLTIFILNKFFQTQGKVQTENRNLILENIELLLHNIKNFKIINKNYIFKKKIFNSINQLVRSELLIVIYKSVSSLYEPIIVFIVILLIVVFKIDLSTTYFADIVVILVLYNRIFSKLNVVSANLSGLNLFKVPLERIGDMLNKFQNNKENFTGLKNFKLEKKIIIRDLTFKHKKNQVFDRINLEIPAKKTTSIYGKSGSGKTTLADLFVKLYDLNKVSGEILFDQTNIFEMNPLYLRRNIGYVTQDTYLFNSSVRFNLIISDDHSKDDELISLLKLFKMEKIFKDRNIDLDKQIIGGGNNISGGQKQRILIIRELLKNPKLIIFDEGLGSLENDNKKYVLETIRDYNPDITILNFTHDQYFKNISDNVIQIN